MGFRTKIQIRHRFLVYRNEVSAMPSAAIGECRERDEIIGELLELVGSEPEEQVEEQLAHLRRRLCDHCRTHGC
jgi:hypothetical protein